MNCIYFYYTTFIKSTVWTFVFLTFFIIILGLIESKSNGCQTILKSMQNKKTQNNGPFLAKVPVHHMVQNYNDDKIKNTSPTSLSSHGQVY